MSAAPARSAPANLIPGALQRKLTGVRINPDTVNHQARGFVNRDDLGILIEDFDRLINVSSHQSLQEKYA